MLTKDFSKDFDYLIDQIGKKPFSFTRYADGEYAVINKENITGYDWKMSTENHKAQKEILEGVNILTSINSDRNFIGISCPCCDVPKYTFYKNFFSQFYYNNQITYSNLFVNGNYKKAVEWVDSLNSCFILLNNKAKYKKVKNYYIPFYFPDNILENNRDKEKEVIDTASINKNQIFLVCLGPYSEIIIPKLVKANSNNYYIDIGSILDPRIHGITREYQKEHSEFSSRVCSNL